MRIAVLPFNCAEGTPPALGRQFAAFASEQLRLQAEADINTISLLTGLQDESGEQRMAFINIPDESLPYEQLKELFDQAEVALIQHGYLVQNPEGFDLDVRYYGKESEEPIRSEKFSFKNEELLTALHQQVKLLAEMGHVTLPESLAGDKLDIGTDNPECFLNFLEGYDGVSYIQQAEGRVANEFSPQGAIDCLEKAIDLDEEFEGPYLSLIQLCRLCTTHRIGTLELIEATLKKLIERFPNEFQASYALGELYASVGNASFAAEQFERVIQLEPTEPSTYARLGMAQMQLGMPVNAERNFRKAMEMEQGEKPSAELLANVLVQTGRAHEVPPLWKSLLEADSKNAVLHTRYATALIQNGNNDQGEKAFETALQEVEDAVFIKRFYAPYLAQKGDLDRAMDFYEDVLDTAPTDVPALMEYAQTLDSADRSFEVPTVLKTVLANTQDPNIRAQAMARLIELEQPKRVESVNNAQQKMEAGDFATALREIKPLKNWLADYWKLWYFIAVCANRTEQYEEAEEAAKRTLSLFPAFEDNYNELTHALAGQEKHQEVYEFLRMVAMQNQNSLNHVINYAIAAKNVGNVDEAKALAKQIREAVGPNPELEPVLEQLER